jgi:hypothetical protein
MAKPARQFVMASNATKMASGLATHLRSVNKWSLRVVTLHGLPVICRLLCC